MTKKLSTILLVLCMIMGLAACGETEVSKDSETVSASSETVSASVENETSASAEEKETVTESTEPVSVTEEAQKEEGAVLVVVFSATGNTKKVAEKIAEFEGADLYEIIPAEVYTEADLNYYDNNSRSIKEQNDKSCRPEIASETIDISGYGKIYIGYPIWCAIEPRIMDTFVESYDFGDTTVIPFCTSGSSGLGMSGSNLEKLAGSGNWEKGKRFAANVSDDKIKEWVDSLK
ncbi:MAG: flavodoxin [Lachnospiraceae bacterium]|nr:flavodoxin [Lachnospiraceae bacterium]